MSAWKLKRVGVPYSTGEPGEETAIFRTVLHRVEEFDSLEAICSKGKDPVCQCALIALLYH
jgi:hypothetical protein